MDQEEAMVEEVATEAAAVATEAVAQEEEEV